MFLEKLKIYTKDNRESSLDRISKNNSDKIIFNWRVALFLMCQEANSQRKIFKENGMEHIIAFLKHHPMHINDLLRFSKALLNFSLKTPNSRIGSTFSIFVEPFFYLVTKVLDKELRNFSLENNRTFLLSCIEPCESIN